jgi:hypothetical protein
MAKFSQPMIAGAVVPESLSSGQRASRVNGLDVIKNGAGDFHIELDEAPTDPGSLVFVVTPYYEGSPIANKSVTAYVTYAGTAGATSVSVTLLDDAHAAIDAGFTMAVFELVKVD